MEPPISAETNRPASWQLWPEALRDQPRSDRFPISHFLRWLAPGVVAILFFAALFVVLQLRANRQIVYLLPSGQLSLVQANRENSHPIGDASYQFDSPVLVKGRQALQMLGGPQWSLEGATFATTVTENDRTQVALFQSDIMTPTFVTVEAPGFVALPANGWSADGFDLALIGHDGDRASLVLVNRRQGSIFTFDWSLDARVGVDWHPNEAQLLLTRLEQDVPQLVVMEMSGNLTPYRPDDQKEMHADGAWSLDGNQVAYVTADAYDPATTSLLLGEIWVADRSGANARRLAEGQNLAPRWSPTGEYVFFLRYVPTENAFDLYRVDANGEHLTRIGSAADAFVRFPFDRPLFMAWSADQERLFFLGRDEQQQLTIYAADGAGRDVQSLPSQCSASEPFATRWSPITSTLLIACPTSQLRLHSFAEAQPAVELPDSSLASWSADGKTIAFVTPGGRLAAVETDSGEAVAVGDREYRLDSPLLLAGQQPMQLLGGPRWSPDGSRFATTVLLEGKNQVALFDRQGTNLVTIAPTFDLMALPGNSWSASGNYLALIEHDGNRALLSRIDVIQGQSVALELTLDTRAGFAWHPEEEELLLTGWDENGIPTLYLVLPNGEVQPFASQDNQVIHADGTWSPDGNLVAYVAAASAEEYDVHPLLTGQIWLADGNGQNARMVVSEGENFAPQWSADGEYIFFTRYLAEGNLFEFYRVGPDGQELIRIGPGSSTQAWFPYDRHFFLGWSDNGRRMFWVGRDEQEQQIIFQAAADGSNSQPLAAQCESARPFAVQWAPTNRSLLVACPDGHMFLQWVERRADQSDFSPGLLPSWEP